MSEGYDLPAPERITIGTVGPVGDRLFLLQCRQGPTLLTLKIEKQQVAVVADYLARIVLTRPRPGHLPDELELEEPAEPAWVVGTVGVSYDDTDDRVILVIEELVPEDETGAIARLSISREQAAAFAIQRHPAGRVGPPSVPALRIPPRSLRTRVPADQRPPSAGGVTGWSPAAGPGLESVDRAAPREELSVVGRLPWSSNLTFLVSLEGSGDGATGEPSDVTAEDDPPGPLHGVYKPATRRASLWDFPDGLYRREVAAYALSEALGWGLVPATVERDDGPFGSGSLQLFVAADYEQHYFTLFDDEATMRTTLRTMCVFDVVANNADRKSGHVPPR